MNVAVDIPDNIFFGINETPASLANLLKEKLALELYQTSRITLSQGAKMLGIDLYDFIRLLGQNGIPVIDDYDIASEVESVRDILQ